MFSFKRFRFSLKRLKMCLFAFGLFFLYCWYSLEQRVEGADSPSWNGIVIGRFKLKSIGNKKHKTYETKYTPFLHRLLKKSFLSTIEAMPLKLSVFKDNQVEKGMVDIIKEHKVYKPRFLNLSNQLLRKISNYSTLSTPSKSSISATQLKDNEFEEKDMIDENGNPYTILIWKSTKVNPSYFANPQVCLGNISCIITYNKSALDTVHAIAFDVNKMDVRHLPRQDSRKYYQQYAWWTLENPLHTLTSKTSNLTNYFNLTFHYRTDADVYAPYGSINLVLRELKAAGETDLESLLEKKKNSGKMAAWAVSNCYGSRMNYAKSLMGAGLQVDTYGECFGGREIGKGRYSDSFYEALSRYKFYFSFENSITCKDYFTEKFWFNGLRSGAVPIVWGPRKEDILKVAPTKSFIHTSDFSSPQKLVEYLNYLASNETAYAEYLEWRTWVNHPERIEERLKMKNRDNDLRSFCKLCSILQADGRRRKLGLKSPQRIISNISESWISPEKGECHE